MRRESEEQTQAVETQSVEALAVETAAPDSVGSESRSKQSEERPAGNAFPTVEELQNELKSLESNEAVDEKQRETLKSLVGQSLDWLKLAAELETRAQSNLSKSESVPAQVEQLKATLRKTSAEPELPNLENQSTQSIETAVLELKGELSHSRERLQSNKERASKLGASRKESQQKLQEIFGKREGIKEQLNLEPATDTSPLFRKLQVFEWNTHIAYLDAREKLIKSESQYARAITAIEPLQHDLDQRVIARTEALYKHFNAALKAKQDQELQAKIAEAQRKAKDADPDLHALAEHNLELAELRSKYHELFSEAREELDSIRVQFEAQEKSFHSIQEKVDQIGMTEAIGVLLRSQDHELINHRPLLIRAAEIEKELPHVELSRITAKEERNKMANMESLIEEYAVRIAQRLPEEEAEAMVRELLETRRDYLGDLQAELGSYEETLGDLHIALENTARVTNDHHQYISEHVLWIRSSAPVSLADVNRSRQGIAILFDPARWMRVLADVGQAIQSRMMLSLSCFAAMVVGLVLIDRLKDRITEVGESRFVQTDYRFGPTVEVAIETILLASVFPAICMVASWGIARASGVSELTTAIGIGLKWTAITWLGLSLLQQVVRPNGLAERHFRWHESNSRVVRKNMQFLLLFGLPTVFLVMVIESFQDGVWNSSFGRLSFMAGMLVMALFMHRLLTPYRKAVGNADGQSNGASAKKLHSSGVWANRDVWLYKFRYVLHACCVLLPIAFAVLAAIGYGYSAHQLAYRAHLSLWLAMLVVLGHAMIARYFRIARRAAAVRHMQRKRAEAESSDSDIPIEDELDFQTIGDQLQRLLRGSAIAACLLGLSMIWVDMVPALMMLDDSQYALWSTTQMVTENVPQDDGSVQVRSTPETVPVTLGDLLMCLLAVSVTVMAARNIPGLLNVTILERLPIDYGTRYAMTAVSRYVISLIGIVVAFNFIGITWGSVQWLVAAMTVGLGFGLQEIFANFVSGLIILMERPIRVGDIVTVGGVMGKVTRVQIRATTITDFDRRELVVPNRRFITEDVINWTLSDPITRLVLPVGIAYHCDPQLGRQKLLEAAQKHPLVLKDPEPNAVFMGFGDSTLDLELRVFIVGRDQAFEVRDQLNLAINEAFKQADLEIAFPQRDLHIRTVDSAVANDPVAALIGGASPPKPMAGTTEDKKEAA